MEPIINFLKNLEWHDWAAAVGIIFGIVTLIAYLDQRRSNKQQNRLIEFVNRHLDKDISEETIKELKEQQDEMQRQVKEHIPALARAAVLKEQAESHASAITHHYKEWTRINNELGHSPSDGKLDKEIEAIIVDRLSPKYEHQWALEAVRNRITALSIAIALSSTFLFYPLNLLVGIPLAFPLVKGLLEFLKLQGVSSNFLKNSKFFIFLIFIMAIIASGFFGSILILLDGVTTEGRILSIFMIVVAFLALVFIKKVYKSIENFLNKQFNGVKSIMPNQANSADAKSRAAD